MASDPNLQVLGAAYIQHKCYSDVTAKKQVACCPVDTPTAHLPGDPQADLAHPILPRAFSAENGWEGRMCTHLHTSAHTCVHLPTSAHTCIYLHTSHTLSNFILATTLQSKQNYAHFTDE